MNHGGRPTVFCFAAISMMKRSATIRLAIAQGQPLGNERFTQMTCAATGVRRTQARRGKPMKTQESNSKTRDELTAFGF